MEVKFLLCGFGLLMIYGHTICFVVHRVWNPRLDTTVITEPFLGGRSRNSLGQMMKEAFCLKNTANRVHPLNKTPLPTKRDSGDPKLMTNFRKGNCNTGQKRHDII
ncbi:hypothetical protein KSP39_PZI019499 [Platanthera zijinensis]|uniref:Uncharacterized protein n=1 Tax=Platanthera zijinensis TaxID=2320716 RepID=A0AAP0B1G8_9ASPA